MKVLRRVVALVGVGLFLAGTAQLADAQVGPIQTVPGYNGCLGNNQIQDVPPGGLVCANQRTFTVQAGSRTIVAVSTMRADGTASVTFTLDSPVNVDVPVRVRSHSGISSSSGPLIDDKAGVIPAGQTTTTVDFAFDCGQVDVKAVFTAPGNGLGRISGGYFCKPLPPPPTTPTTAPAVPTTAPAVTTPGAPVTTAVASSARVSGTLPPTGSGPHPAVYLALGLVLAGSVVVVLVRRST